MCLYQQLAMKQLLGAIKEKQCEMSSGDDESNQLHWNEDMKVHLMTQDIIVFVDICFD